MCSVKLSLSGTRQHRGEPVHSNIGVDAFLSKSLLSFHASIVRPYEEEV